MKVQVNSDKTIAMSARFTQFVEKDVNHILRRFAARLTRVEVHLSDIDNVKKGQADKRCLLEARPAGARPRTASAVATKVDLAVTAAAEKMQSVLGTYFGRLDGYAASAVSTPVPVAKKRRPKRVVAKKTASVETEARSRKRAAAKEAAKAELLVEHFTEPAVEPANHDVHSRAKKRIYQARRRPWPTR
ncbi:MAG: hypothetical protein KGN79_11345 [Acidobacteriota bacterium]|nr:hypothetical protein [Acidobacteriota bacterium]